MGRQAKSGRVSQVVKAFETRLVMDDSGLGKGFRKPTYPSLKKRLEMVKSKNEAVLHDLNEYETNFFILVLGVKRRALDEIDGEVAETPTAEKRFVGENDGTDKVEEASLEWPHPDK
ncbi:unnamed protein product [Linum trigynum]|uniref:Uncharacterized protein n=1 Tax=Linum trigynum TaxID=586398 RepID=A0AAV2EAL0_9ROSI